MARSAKSNQPAPLRIWLVPGAYYIGDAGYVVRSKRRSTMLHAAIEKAGGFRSEDYAPVSIYYRRMPAVYFSTGGDGRWNGYVKGSGKRFFETDTGSFSIIPEHLVDLTYDGMMREYETEVGAFVIFPKAFSVYSTPKKMVFGTLASIYIPQDD